MANHCFVPLCRYLSSFVIVRVWADVIIHRYSSLFVGIRLLMSENLGVVPINSKKREIGVCKIIIKKKGPPPSSELGRPSGCELALQDVHNLVRRRNSTGNRLTKKKSKLTPQKCVGHTKPPPRAWPGP